MTATAPTWISAFLDLAHPDYERGVVFWGLVTGYRVSSPRGEQQEFATLVPRDGDDFLRVQRLGDGRSRIHLDLHVPDPAAAAAAAQELGATVTTESEHGYVVLASPGGLVFCFVGHHGAVRPRPQSWRGGHRSLVDQVCLDIPRDIHDAETAFWQALLGWEPAASSVSADFSVLQRPEGQPFRFLLQRLGEGQGRVRAHLDLATDDRTAEVARHVALGARVRREHPRWTVLADATGSAYCITDRDPETGSLPVGPGH
ncbi:VOC family protein [Nocardioides sp. KIGAM211]|uniref:VOC family protein n=1 Tax=Nocardioides luti TaxID=2761101 RepID=A0A7X0REW8_9ACTN|nr:VOC family protein [Nocardioides luti]MBB6627022.1 VOC family protein [Nocardioides luti]